MISFQNFPKQGSTKKMFSLIVHCTKDICDGLRDMVPFVQF